MKTLLVDDDEIICNAFVMAFKSKGCCLKVYESAEIGLSTSLSVSEIRKEDTAISVVERADAALYLAKNSGRNNVKSEKDFKSAQT